MWAIFGDFESYSKKIIIVGSEAAPTTLGRVKERRGNTDLGLTYTIKDVL